MRTFTIFCLLLLSTLAGFGQWSYLGLSTTQTTDLTICGDTLYASTTDGIYKKSVQSTDTLWSACGLQGNHVIQTLVPDHQTFICVVEAGVTCRTQIYKSTNGGKSFTLLNKGLSALNSYDYLDKVAHPEGNYDSLYFLDHGIRTFDGGITWDTLTQIAECTNRFIQINPKNSHQLFIGGETMILSPYIQTSTDRGDQWHFLPNMGSFFAGDNAIHDMIIDGNNWYAAGEGVIGKTSDGGNTWEPLLNNWSRHDHWSLYFTDIEFSPVNKNHLYVTGLGYYTDIIPLLHSSDRGITWDTLAYRPVNLPAGSTTDVTCLTIINSSGGDRVFLGGKGVYVYRNTAVGIPDIPVANNLTVYPNPTDKSLTIIVPDKSRQLQIINMQGKIIDNRKLSGQKQIDIGLENKGIYLIQVITNTERLTRKVIVQ